MTTGAVPQRSERPAIGIGGQRPVMGDIMIVLSISALMRA
jgi:hypothetical protein